MDGWDLIKWCFHWWYDRLAWDEWSLLFWAILEQHMNWYFCALPASLCQKILNKNKQTLIQQYIALFPCVPLPSSNPWKYLFQVSKRLHNQIISISSPSPFSPLGLHLSVSLSLTTKVIFLAEAFKLFFLFFFRYLICVSFIYCYVLIDVFSLCNFSPNLTN